MRKTIFAFCTALAIIVAGPSLFAQVGTQGAILGTVSDQSGGVVPGAAVTVRNLDTGLEVSSKSDANGTFEVPALPLGSYSVEVSAQGFKIWKLEHTDLTLGERKRLSIALELGPSSQQVTVTSTPPALQTESAQVGTTVEQKNILDLPLNTRQVTALAELTPGIRYEGKLSGYEGTEIQGGGTNLRATGFTMDGSNINDYLLNGGSAIPGVDTIAEFRVETFNFGAEHGGSPMQVVMSSKSGTNQFHGSLWEFNQNSAANSRNAFAPPGTHQKLVQNQFGGAVGGPIIKDRTFFFFSYEEIINPHQGIINETVVQPAWLNGDFSSLLPGTQLVDPATGAPLPNNQITQVDPAAKFLNQFVISSPTGTFRDLVHLADKTYDVLARIDHNITSKQRIYGHFIEHKHPYEGLSGEGWTPDLDDNSLLQHNWGGNYTYAITPATLLTVTGGYISTNLRANNSRTGKTNFTDQAGIQGFSTERVGSAGIGIPLVIFGGSSGAAGYDGGIATPIRQWQYKEDALANLNLIRGRHSIFIGNEVSNGSGYAELCSLCKGIFVFGDFYSGFDVADYMLGLPFVGIRTTFLSAAGVHRSPSNAAYVQDYWRVSPKVTLNAGLRVESWLGHEFVGGCGSTFDQNTSKIIVDLANNGQVNQHCQLSTQAMMAATQGLWVPRNQVSGFPKGLFDRTSYASPRLGATWQVRKGMVVRGGYGIFPYLGIGDFYQSSYSSPPFWGAEVKVVLPTASRQLQPWETMFPASPTSFSGLSSLGTKVNLGPTKTHEWNIAIEEEMPLKSTLTIGYQGTKTLDEVSGLQLNEVPPGNYPNGFTRPVPELGTIEQYQNSGKAWYHAGTVKWQRKFANGLSFVASYAYSKTMFDGIQHAGAYWSEPDPFTPPRYLRGPGDWGRTHLLTISGVYDLPVGRGRKLLSNADRYVNAVLGGWETSGIVRHQSGQPSDLDVPDATLGNGHDTRPDCVGDWHVSNPSASEWFNPAAFAKPAPFTWGNCGFNIVTGPGLTTLDTALMKNFHFSEARYIQIRWEMFNATNHVNLGQPGRTFGTPTFGQILSAGPARVMQFAMKVYF